MSLPLIDITGLYSACLETRQSVGIKILKACKTHGFFYIKGYDISVKDIAQTFSVSKQFFDQSLDFKKQTSIDHSDQFQGYEYPTERESKEAFVIGPERDKNDILVQQGVKYHGANQWPDLKGWQQVVMRQSAQMLRLARLLNRGLALGLGIDEDYFDLRSKDPMYAFRMLHYPPGDNARAGIAEHTDWGALSLLIQDETQGLEVKTKDGNWLKIAPIPDTIVVNVGEMVERWMGGTVKAIPHRVYNNSAISRYSLAFFLDMDHDAMIEKLPCFMSENTPVFKPIRVDDFIDLMHRRDYG